MAVDVNNRPKCRSVARVDSRQFFCSGHHVLQIYFFVEVVDVEVALILGDEETILLAVKFALNDVTFCFEAFNAPEGGLGESGGSVGYEIGITEIHKRFDLFHDIAFHFFIF